MKQPSGPAIPASSKLSAPAVNLPQSLPALAGRSSFSATHVATPALTKATPPVPAPYDHIIAMFRITATLAAPVHATPLQDSAPALDVHPQGLPSNWLLCPQPFAAPFPLSISSPNALVATSFSSSSVQLTGLTHTSVMAEQSPLQVPLFPVNKGLTECCWFRFTRNSTGLSGH